MRITIKIKNQNHTAEPQSKELKADFILNKLTSAWSREENNNIRLRGTVFPDVTGRSRLNPLSFGAR
jgi:hypothetical protein